MPSPVRATARRSSESEAVASEAVAPEAATQEVAPERESRLLGSPSTASAEAALPAASAPTPIALALSPTPTIAAAAVRSFVAASSRPLPGTAGPGPQDQPWTAAALPRPLPQGEPAAALASAAPMPEPTSVGQPARWLVSGELPPTPAGRPADAVLHTPLSPLRPPRKRAAPTGDPRGLDLVLTANTECASFLDARDIKRQDRLLERLEQKGLPAAKAKPGSEKKAEFALLVRECTSSAPYRSTEGPLRRRVML
mmetsp:Transcript_105047/g.224401  ORF Transcript_105047/g.224401 Transcript_105047/m.224401 type:complete len:255 (-) Transcript_105047:70-834(-)